jgi:hypothetical protein
VTKIIVTRFFIKQGKKEYSSKQTCKNTNQFSRLFVRSSGSVHVKEFQHCCHFATIHKCYIPHLQNSFSYTPITVQRDGSNSHICAVSIYVNSETSYTTQIMCTSFIMKLYCTPLAILGAGHLAPSGKLMHLKP